MFHDKKSCRKMTFLSFILAACKECVFLVQKASHNSCNRHLVLYQVKPNPSQPCKRQRSGDSSNSDFAYPSPEPEDITCHGSRISCVTPVGSQDEAVLEAFPRMLLNWPLGHKTSFFRSQFFKFMLESIGSS